MVMMKESSYGRDISHYGRKELLDMKTIHVKEIP